MENPLLDLSGLPRFGEISPHHVLPAIDQLLADYRTGLDRIGQRQAEPGWGSLVDAETRLADRLMRAWSAVSHLSRVQDSPELRSVYSEALQAITRHSSERSQNQDLFQAYQNLSRSEWFTGLAGPQQQLIKNELRDFHRAGVDLSAKDRARYRELVDQLSRLGNQFSENLLDATNGWKKLIDQADDLAGLPDNELNLLAGLAQQSGEDGWLVNLSFPSYNAVLTYANDRQLREMVYQAYVTRASDQGPNAGQWDNGPLIGEILAAQHELANLLGFDNYPEYALEIRMAVSPEQVMEFLNALLERARPVARQQFEELGEFARQQGGPGQLQAWDLAYWSEKLRQQRYAISDKQLRPYLAVDRVIEGLFTMVRQLYGVRMKTNPEVAVWHPDVHYVDLLDESNQVIGGIFLDLYARDDKRGGAWMDICQSRLCIGQEQQMPVAFLSCNFPPATGHSPSLLGFRDVETLFHECGHCLHHLLTEIDWPQVNGISGVEWDAVELPSQIMENWCIEKPVLDSFTRHVDTGQPLPDDLYQKLWNSRHFQKAMQLIRQLEFAIADMRLHVEYDPGKPADPNHVMEQVRQAVAVTPSPAYNRFLNGFSHLFNGGYAAGYYSYLWAEQLSEDAFQRFREEGLFNAETGRSFRREILAVGSSRPAAESFRAFRGREPDIEPLLASYDVAGDHSS